MIYLIIIAIAIALIAKERAERRNAEAYIKKADAMPPAMIKRAQYAQYRCARCGKLIKKSMETFRNDVPYCGACACEMSREVIDKMIRDLRRDKVVALAPKQVRKGK